MPTTIIRVAPLVILRDNVRLFSFALNTVI